MDWYDGRRCGVIMDRWKQMEGRKLRKLPGQEWGSRFDSVCHRFGTRHAKVCRWFTVLSASFVCLVTLYTGERAVFGYYYLAGSVSDSISTFRSLCTC
jgi:hypothetical protein